MECWILILQAQKCSPQKGCVYSQTRTLSLHTHTTLLSHSRALHEFHVSKNDVVLPFYLPFSPFVSFPLPFLSFSEVLLPFLSLAFSLSLSFSRYLVRSFSLLCMRHLVSLSLHFFFGTLFLSFSCALTILETQKDKNNIHVKQQTILIWGSP